MRDLLQRSRKFHGMEVSILKMSGYFIDIGGVATEASA